MHRRKRLAFAAFVLGFACAAPAFAQNAEPLPSDTTPPGLLAADPGSAPAGLAADQTPAEPALQPPLRPGRPPSGVAARLADWITVTGDNGGRPFMIVDKLAAEVFAFDADGRLLGSAPVLVGLARGDDSAPGIGDLQLSAIAPDERTTPAGRFEAQYGPSNGHGTMLWVDFADAISLHPVMSVNAGERRQERIRSASPQEHRISYGCINVPAAFYHDVVEASFVAGGVVYVLPDTKPLAEVFPAFAALADDGATSAQASLRCAEQLLDVPGEAPESSVRCQAGERQTAEASGTR